MVKPLHILEKRHMKSVNVVKKQISIHLFIYSLIHHFLIMTDDYSLFPDNMKSRI